MELLKSLTWNTAGIMLPLVSERKQSSMIGVGHGWMHGSVDESGFVGIQSTQHHWIPTRCEPGPELDFRFLSQDFTIPRIIKNWIALYWHVSFLKYEFQKVGLLALHGLNISFLLNVFLCFFYSYMWKHFAVDSIKKLLSVTGEEEVVTR